MCISARDDSLSWPMHALLYVCSRLKELALLKSFGFCIWPVSLRFLDLAAAFLFLFSCSLLPITYYTKN